MNKKQEISDLAYNNFIFKKLNISDKEFNNLSDDIKCKHLQMFSNKINDTQKRKVIASDLIFNEQLGKMEDEYNKLLDIEKRVLF